jgi:hypothetical protein
MVYLASGLTGPGSGPSVLAVNAIGWMSAEAVFRDSYRDLVRWRTEAAGNTAQTEQMDLKRNNSWAILCRAPKEKRLIVFTALAGELPSSPDL